MPDHKPKLLEVIVTSLEDALEAEAGGAGRLEVVRALEVGGLTPDLDLVSKIQARARIPFRVMLRENPSMELAGPEELRILSRQAAEMHSLGASGLVAGFIAEGKVDLAAMDAIANAAPDASITFHRAFDELHSPTDAINILKERLPQVDRILSVGGAGLWNERKPRLEHWQQCAGPQIAMLAGAGLEPDVLQDLAASPELREVHVGRAARIPRETHGRVDRHAVAKLKDLLS